ncbi:MAG: hypothetical protein H0U23_04815 [Blastocatellia bacterium]|nr:hypothetical protein [Blastocatellia bacterium]
MEIYERIKEVADVEICSQNLNKYELAKWLEISNLARAGMSGNVVCDNCGNHWDSVSPCAPCNVDLNMGNSSGRI